ncbi:fumarylacetoacetate hydrolase family protein [Azospirillum sp. ST 5-10]|uniref:fumarylacetoacetate hydrolase family protein n=1 Tax=unclassified Azospirillum TaxID=2630922 RepID=UPI003F4A5C3F
MRYVSFDDGGVPSLGAVRGNGVVPVSGLFDGAPRSLRALIAAGAPLQAEVARRVAEAPEAALVPLDACRLLPPVGDPGKVVCLGLNYADHAKEGGHAVPDYPSLFLRCTTSLIGPGASMVVPACSERLDYEAELMIVVGRRCRHVPEERALDVVFGYTAFNDGSVRDYQRRTAQWTAGKNFDGTGPIGPWVVTADALPPGAAGLRIRSLLNGETMQDSDTGRMIFGVARTIAILSEIMTLEPGDLIATGTPAGVGHARRPPVWLKPGDTIAIEIEGIGTLSNPVTAEAAGGTGAAAGTAAELPA